jgi:hypothetical protein
LAPDATTEAVEEEAAPALTPESEQMLELLQRELGDAIVEHGATLGDVVVRVALDQWRHAAEVCRMKLDCD